MEIGYNWGRNSALSELGSIYIRSRNPVHKRSEEGFVVTFQDDVVVADGIGEEIVGLGCIMKLDSHLRAA